MKRTYRIRLAAVVLAPLLLSALALGAEPTADSRTGVAAITVPAGFVVEKVAGPPLVERPMLASFDDRGRLFVCDSAGVNLRGAELSKNPPHAIRMLEDTDGDGRFDKTTLFADKLVFPQGIVWHDGAVYCSSPPSFWRLADTDGDGVADQREELLTGFANTGVADDMHGGSLGPDGRLYFCAGRFPHEIHRPGQPPIHKGTAPLIIRCRPDGSEPEVVCGSQGNAVGVVFTPAGDMFASGTFLAPNSMGAGLRDALVHCVDGAEYPVRDRTLNEHRRTGDLLPPLTHLGVAAASDLAIARGDALGEGYRGNLFSALFNMHKVMRHRLEPAGATWQCRNEDFLVSSDPDFHPTDVFEDADGSLLVIDTGGWFRIGCPTSQIAKPDVMGAIYRVRRVNAPKVADPRGLKIDWLKLSPAAAAELLADARPDVRERAMAELAKRGASGVSALRRILAAGANEETKCAAVWTLARVDADEARAAVRQALDDRAAAVRQAAARAAGLHRDRKAESRLAQLVKSDAPAVRREAATSLGRLGDASAVQPLLDALTTTGDRFAEHAIIFALIRIGDRPATLRGLETASSPTQRGALIALDQMDGGQLTPEMVTPFLTRGEPLVQQTALWVIAHHSGWGQAMTGFFRQWLARRDMDEARRDELQRQLLAFAKDPTVQELIGASLADPRTSIETRLLLLEVIAAALPGRLPDVWADPLAQALEHPDERVVSQAVAALRSLPLDKRPVAARVDRQVDFPEVTKNFAGTKLNEHFCARWSGIVRCPKAGKYAFYTQSDDGSQLFIDGSLVVDNGGAHAMRERHGDATLEAGDHALRLEFVQGEGQAGCKLSWSFDGREQQVIPAEALFHRAAATSGRESANVETGLRAEFYELGGEVETFPDLAASRFDAALLRIAADPSQPVDLRVQAASVVVSRQAIVDAPLFGTLMMCVGQDNTPLVRLEAAEALGRAQLNDAQLKAVAEAFATAGVLEVPKLLPAFEHSSDAAVGTALVASLAKSPGLKGIRNEQLVTALASYPETVRQQAAALSERLVVDASKQTARLAELSDVLSGGDIQRGRELFFRNKKAICATCHAVQGAGGKFGPDLSKIGAIRTPRDLLEAIVFPSASFARGYEPFNVLTDDGRQTVGIISRETADAVYVVGTTRVETRIARSAIETLSQSPVSIMPEGMDAQLTREELGDLIAFLQSLR